MSSYIELIQIMTHIQQWTHDIIEMGLVQLDTKPNPYLIKHKCQMRASSLAPSVINTTWFCV